MPDPIPTQFPDGYVPTPPAGYEMRQLLEAGGCLMIIQPLIEYLLRHWHVMP